MPMTAASLTISNSQIAGWFDNTSFLANSVGDRFIRPKRHYRHHHLTTVLCEHHLHNHRQHPHQHGYAFNRSSYYASTTNTE